MAVAMTQMGKHYGLPVYVNVGLTDSKRPDGQAGMEAGVTLLSGALAGADIFGHLGIGGVDQGASLPMLMLQHELIGYVERILRGIEVSDETLGLDVIREVGHDGSSWRSRTPSSTSARSCGSRNCWTANYWSTWLEGGAGTLYDRCVRQKEKALAEHQPVPLDRRHAAGDREGRGCGASGAGVMIALCVPYEGQCIRCSGR